ncbi:phosphopantetheine-binding protein [Streptomyces afghaniensis]|jgi:acyl carrier protein|uniref:Acyl carrier protein n=8 Tax=Streptomyces TaxID=1883 RepID=A0A5J6I6C9_STRC4|nr:MULTISPECIES: phosphopantetheine-binding protein [Streptomyces]EPJ39196.1 putative Acyl carrier protein [Streptomyces afghaniensis 772]MBB3075114.1 acyl carrier protein [Streptomyces violarus]MCE7045884.1 acyl carrier protein [Streptomyces purpurascens]MCT9137862.1 acyl carrier protein [Streptomyces violarus]MDQ0751419.1 acyl carrier protein [Streptomyces africanus]
MQAIAERVSVLLSDQFKVKPEIIASEVTLGKLSFDSLVLIELGLVLDKEFGVEIADGELTEEHTLDDLVQLLSAKGAAV